MYLVRNFTIIFGLYVVLIAFLPKIHLFETMGSKKRAIFLLA